MSHSQIVICSVCLQGYSDLTLRFCVHDGTRLSMPVNIPWSEEEEIETVLRSAPMAPTTVSGTRMVEKPKRRKTNPKAFLQKNFPELMSLKRRTSRPWLSDEKPEYNNNWWFNFVVEHIENADHILFVGALDRDDRDFKVFKVPTEFLKANLSNMDKTADGWVNLYIHIKDYKDLRSPAGISFREYLIN